MAVQVLEPATGEFHPIAVILAEDYTDVTCAQCGPLGQTGDGVGHWRGTANGAAHAIGTGHTVLERHVRLTVISERP